MADSPRGLEPMFEDESIDVACPKCGRRNSVLVRALEDQAEIHFVCAGCAARVKLEANEFRHRLDQVREELEDLEREAARGGAAKPKRQRKDDFQI
jgi:transcription elongation factor Elf1